MFENLLAALSAFRPIAWRTAVALLFVSSILLFAPASFISHLGLEILIRSSKPAISIAFLLSLGVISVEIVDILVQYFRSMVKNFRYRMNTRRFIIESSTDEKAILKRYLDENTSTIHLDMTDGSPEMLKAKGLITRTSNVGLPGLGAVFPYSIQPVALRLIRRNPEILN